MAVPDEASHPAVAGASLSREVQHCCKRRSHVPPPPSALMPFEQEKRRSVAAMKAKENNRRVSSRITKMQRPLRAADKEPLHRKLAEAVAVHRRQYPDYAHHPREARRRKEQERIAKQVTSKLKNASSWDKEQQPTTCTVAAQGRSSPKFKQQLHPPRLPPTPSSKHRGTISAARVGASGVRQGTVASMTTDNVPATTKDLEGQVVPVKVAALRALA
ncbi:sex-determining region Y protein-like [Dermacentor silvarum]|uniref:sex-determining region Y protein-like n=1 Tax=Dermacentor silvarum TaxID=543639 RepID=UPI00189A6ADD|nr:sex-determining region Y protein-like [Dermacentor silvarum]